MEAVAYVAGEPHSDHPACTSPVLTTVAIRLNDLWTDDERQLLARLIPRLVGTRTTHEHDVRRAYVMVDGTIREVVPLWIEAIGWRDLAARIRDLAPIVDVETARAARKVCNEVRDAARKLVAASASATDAAAYAAAYAAQPEERARQRSAARRPIVEATLRVFERAISTP